MEFHKPPSPEKNKALEWINSNTLNIDTCKRIIFQEYGYKFETLYYKVSITKKKGHNRLFRNTRPKAKNKKHLQPLDYYKVQIL